MDIGIVTAKSAKFSDQPGGKLLANLPVGTHVAVRGGPVEWVEVEYQGVVGVIARRSLKIQFRGPAQLSALAAPPTVPPKARPSDIKVLGTGVFGPQGIRFGTLYRHGLFNYGVTRLGDFFEEDPNSFPELPPSILRVMQAVSDNEGKLEAINTYDNSFLSCSVYQWTMGEADKQGELPYALNFLKSDAPNAFQTYFGDDQLDVDVRSSDVTGFFILNGQTLDSASKKSVLRDRIWAYRFWRAAHDVDVRRSYVRAAISRIDRFYPVKIAALGNRPMSDFLTAEVSVAHLLDQHVNRPGHVPRTLVKAIKAFIAGGGSADPSHWRDKDEQNVIRLYLAERKNTSMTDSEQRGDNINAYVSAGKLSNKRHSYKA